MTAVLRSLAIGLALLAPVPLHATGQAVVIEVPRPPGGASLESATKLASLFESEQKTHAYMRRMTEETLPAMLRARPNAAATEAKYPTIFIDVARAMGRIIERNAIERLPDLWAAQGREYARTMTQQQVDDIITFLLSPVGVKLRHEIAAGFNFLALMQASFEQKSERDKQAAYKHGVDTAVTAVVSKLDAADRAQIATFSRSPAVRAMNANAAAIDRINSAWALERSPGVTAEIDAAIVQAVAAARGSTKHD